MPEQFSRQTQETETEDYVLELTIQHLLYLIYQDPNAAQQEISKMLSKLSDQKLYKLFLEVQKLFRENVDNAKIQFLLEILSKEYNSRSNISE